MKTPAASSTGEVPSLLQTNLLFSWRCAGKIRSPEKVLLVIKKWGKGTADTEGEALNSTGHFFLSALRRKNPNVHVVGIKKAKHSVAFGPL